MILVHAAIHQTTQMSVRAELEAMLVTDQMGRLQLDALTKEYGAFSFKEKEFWKKQKLIDQGNCKRLAEIVDQYGWPKKSLVGEDGAKAAFLVLQHGGLAFQKQYLLIFRAAAQGGEANLNWLALLEDRVLVGDGKKQLYGTQVSSKEGVEGFKLDPIEDEVNVDERRARMGLGPLADYLKRYGIEYRKPTKSAPNP